MNFQRVVVVKGLTIKEELFGSHCRLTFLGGITNQEISANETIAVLNYKSKYRNRYSLFGNRFYIDKFSNSLCALDTIPKGTKIIGWLSFVVSVENDIDDDMQDKLLNKLLNKLLKWYNNTRHSIV